MVVFHCYLSLPEGNSAPGAEAVNVKLAVWLYQVFAMDCTSRAGVAVWLVDVRGRVLFPMIACWWHERW